MMEILLLLLLRRPHIFTNRNSSGGSSLLRRLLLSIMVIASTTVIRTAYGFAFSCCQSSPIKRTTRNARKVRYQRQRQRHQDQSKDYFYDVTRHNHRSFPSSTTATCTTTLLFLSSDCSTSSSPSSSFSSPSPTTTTTHTRELEMGDEGYATRILQHQQESPQHNNNNDGYNDYDDDNDADAKNQHVQQKQQNGIMRQPPPPMPLSSSSLTSSSSLLSSPFPYIIPHRKITIRSINWYCNGMLPLQIYQVLVKQDKNRNGSENDDNTCTTATNDSSSNTTRLMLSQLLHPPSSSSFSLSSSSSHQEQQTSNIRIDIDTLIEMAKSSTTAADTTTSSSSHDTTSSVYEELSHSSKRMLLNYDQLSTKQKQRLVQKLRIEHLARNNDYYIHPTSTTTTAFATTTSTGNNNKSSLRSPLHVLYVDEHICVTIKPCGIMSVPGPRQNPSLLEYVYHRSVASYDDGYDGDADSDSQDEDNDEDEIPRNRQITRNRRRDQMVVHRLDMGTSGIIVYALTDEALKQLHTDFKCRNVQKTYHALVEGHFLYGSHHLPVTTTTTTTTPLTCVEGEINVALERDPDNPPFMRIAQPRTPETYTEPVLPSTITEDEEEDNTEEDTPKKNHKFWRQAPKDSLTSYTVLSWEYRNGKPVTRIELRPHTGRTHQLRVHCAQGLGHPIVGDEIYGDCSTGDVGNDADPSHIPEEEDEEESHLCLHAQKLCFYHPISRAPMIFEVDPPF